MALRRLVVVVALVLWPLAVHAQEMALVGTVTDATGGALPGVSVTAVHKESGNTYAGVTDTAGSFVINVLRTGAYALTAELSGFSTVKQDNIEIQIGQRAALTFKMALSTLE